MYEIEQNYLSKIIANCILQWKKIFLFLFSHYFVKINEFEEEISFLFSPIFNHFQENIEILFGDKISQNYSMLLMWACSY